MKKKIQSKQAVNFVKKISTVPKATIFFNSFSKFIFLIFTFSFMENKIVYTPIQSSNRKKYFNHIIYMEKRQLWRE